MMVGGGVLSYTQKCFLSTSRGKSARFLNPLSDKSDTSAEELVLKLCDFGVARQMRELATHLSEEVGWGTLMYMAPEMVFSLNTDGRRIA